MTTNIQHTHTPGPWKISDDRLEEIVGPHDNWLIATINEWNSEYHPYGNSEANARIIAGAPELLEALQCISDGCVMSGEYTHAETVLAYQRIATKAIRKVGGTNE